MLELMQLFGAFVIVLWIGMAILSASAMYLFNFLAAVTDRFPSRWIPNGIERWIVEGCDRNTPVGHPWRNGPMF